MNPEPSQKLLILNLQVCFPIPFTSYILLSSLYDHLLHWNFL